MSDSSYQVIVTADAEIDIAEAINFLNEELEGLGLKFLDSIDEVIDNIKPNPLIYQFRYREFRVAFTETFSYGIHYTVEDNTIYIHAVLHTSREPRE